MSAAQAIRAHDEFASRAPIDEGAWRDAWSMSRLSWLRVGRRAEQARALERRLRSRWIDEHNVWPF